MTQISFRATQRVQASFWDRVLSLPPRFFRRYSSGDLAVRVLAVDQVQQIISGQVITTLLAGVFTFVNLYLMFRYSPTLAHRRRSGARAGGRQHLRRHPRVVGPRPPDLAGPASFEQLAGPAAHRGRQGQGRRRRRPLHRPVHRLRARAGGGDRPPDRDRRVPERGLLVRHRARPRAVLPDHRRHVEGDPARGQHRGLRGVRERVLDRVRRGRRTSRRSCRRSPPWARPSRWCSPSSTSFRKRRRIRTNRDTITGDIELRNVSFRYGDGTPARAPRHQHPRCRGRDGGARRSVGLGQVVDHSPDPRVRRGGGGRGVHRRARPRPPRSRRGSGAVRRGAAGREDHARHHAVQHPRRGRRSARPKRGPRPKRPPSPTTCARCPWA